MSCLPFAIHPVEILLREIQKNRQISGIKIKDFHFKYRAFTDDVVFFTKDPKENIPKVLDIIEKFGRIAGFYVNKTKSKLMLKNIRKEEIANLTECEVVQKVKHLGIEITSKIYRSL